MDASGNVAYSEPGMMCLDTAAVVTQPEDFVGWVGDKATFSVTARGENLTYLWEVSTNGGKTWGSSNVAGVATASMYLYMSETNPGNMYRCKITDGDGNVVYTEPAKVVLGSETWEYTYDVNGMRTSRTNGSHTYTYVYNGGNLSRMTIDGDRFYFTYDASGTPMSISYNNVRYYYVTNIQGDVIALVSYDEETNETTAVVNYTYDAWGNILTTTGTLADTLGEANPLRYRGYVYDEETGLYYLQSRYYDPKIGRFINADAFTSTGQSMLGNNMFSYCGNNPTIRTDESGESWTVAIIIGIAIVATINDIYQLSREDEGAISPSYTHNYKSVKVKNSNHIVTPWVQYGYSYYLNHHSEYKEYFTGSTIGMTYEWTLHNLGAVGFGAAGHVMNAVGLDGQKMLDYSERCVDVDLGPTIYHDDSSTKGVFSHIMKGSYTMLYPLEACYDKIMWYLE